MKYIKYILITVMFMSLCCVPASAVENRLSFSCSNLIDANTVVLKSAVTLKASNPQADETYAFYIRNVGKNDDYMLKDYSSASSIVWYATKEGSKELVLKIKDNKGNVTEYTQVVNVSIPSNIIFNSISLEKTEVVTNERIKVTANAVGGTNTAFKFLAQDPKGNYTTIREWETDNNILFQPTSEGTYNIIVYAKDDTGALIKRTTSLVVKAGLTKGFFINKTDNNVELKMILEDSSKYEYKFVARESDTNAWTNIGKTINGTDYSDNSSLNFDHTNIGGKSFKGLYYFRADVRNKETQEVKSYYYNYFFNYTSPKVVLNSFTISAVDYVRYKQNIKLSADATGDGVTYSFYVAPLNSTVEPHTISEGSNSANWRVLTSGSKILYVKAKDKNGNISTSSKIIHVGINYNFKLKDIETFMLDENNTEILAQAIGRDVQYKFEAYEDVDTEAIVLQDFSYNNLINYSTTTNYHRIKVTAKDVGTGDLDSKYLYLNKVKDTGDIVLDEIKINSFNVDFKNKALELSAEAEGGDNLQYKFYYLDENGDDVLIKDFSSSNTKLWTPDFEGSRDIYVMVKNSSGNTVFGKIEVCVELIKDKVNPSPGTPDLGSTGDNSEGNLPNTGSPVSKPIGAGFIALLSAFIFKFIGRIGDAFRSWR